MHPITAGNFTAVFNCTPAGRASDIMMAPAIKVFNQDDWGLMLCLWSGPPGFDCWTSVAPAFQTWSGRCSELVLLLFRVGLAVEYSSCFISVMNLNLYVHCFDALTFTRTEKFVCLWTTAESRARFAAAWNQFKPLLPRPPPQFTTNRSNAVLLLWVILIVFVRPFPVSLWLFVYYL